MLHYESIRLYNNDDIHLRYITCQDLKSTRYRSKRSGLKRRRPNDDADSSRALRESAGGGALGDVGGAGVVRGSGEGGATASAVPSASGVADETVLAGGEDV